MSPSGKDSTDAYRKMQANAARIAAVTAPQFKLAPATMGALNTLNSMSPALDLYRDGLAKQMAPAIAAINQANSYRWDVLAPELARVASTLTSLNASTYQFATSPGMQALADSVRSYQQFDSIVFPQLTETLRGAIASSLGTEEFTRKLIQTSGFAEALQNIATVNVQLNNFTEMYAKITQPLTETLRAAYEGTKIFDNFDFSLLDDIDEDAFEEFLDEHPELEETYEFIEETLVRRGLISRETFSRAGSRFKSSVIAKHLMIAVIMFSAGAALMFGAKSLPDDLEDDGLMYMGIVGFMYTAYSVHSMVKKAVTPPEAE